MGSRCALSPRWRRPSTHKPSHKLSTLSSNCCFSNCFFGSRCVVGSTTPSLPAFQSRGGTYHAPAKTSTADARPQASTDNACTRTLRLPFPSLRRSTLHNTKQTMQHPPARHHKRTIARLFVALVTVGEAKPQWLQARCRRRRSSHRLAAWEQRARPGRQSWANAHARNKQINTHMHTRRQTDRRMSITTARCTWAICGHNGTH